MDQKYTLTLDTETTIDIDDLMGIVQQLEAICTYNAMDFSCLTEEQVELKYEWKAAT